MIESVRQKHELVQSFDIMMQSVRQKHELAQSFDIMIQSVRQKHELVPFAVRIIMFVNLNAEWRGGGTCMNIIEKQI